MIFDSSGNLYGTSGYGGDNDYGLVFQLTPSESGWTENILYRFQNGSDGYQPWGGLIFDPSGNLYGTTTEGGSGRGGTVFKLTRANGTWSYSLFYSLPAGGYYGPQYNLVIDAAGNLYGTSSDGGSYEEGAVFKLTPGGGGWTYTSLHDFTGGVDGGIPTGLLLDGSGALFGTTQVGGTGPCSGVNYRGCGVVYEITP